MTTVKTLKSTWSFWNERVSKTKSVHFKFEKRKAENSKPQGKDDATLTSVKDLTSFRKFRQQNTFEHLGARVDTSHRLGMYEGFDDMTFVLKSLIHRRFLQVDEIVTAKIIPAKHSFESDLFFISTEKNGFFYNIQTCQMTSPYIYQKKLLAATFSRNLAFFLTEEGILKKFWVLWDSFTTY